VKFNFKALSIPAWGLALVFCAKFYYLFGVTDYLHPNAPMLVIFVRDFFVLSFLAFFGWKVRKHLKGQNFFWVLFGIGIAISFLHFGFGKDFQTWGQHYLRNALLPMLFYPVAVGLILNGEKIQITKVMQLVFWMNLLANYFQIIGGGFSGRLSGLFGDGILNTSFLLFGLSAVVLSSTSGISAVAIFASLPVIHAANSISAIFSFAIGAAFLLVQYRLQVLEKLQKGWRLFIVASFCILLMFFVIEKIGTMNGQVGVITKISYFKDSFFCVDTNCWRHWSYQGRIDSNLRPIELCRDDSLACVLGNFKSSLYERVESTWASLMVNWGLIYTMLFSTWVFRHLWWSFHSTQKQGPNADNEILWRWMFYSILIQAVLNVIIYRFPLNVLFYLCLAYFSASRQLNKNKLQSGHTVN
jgi:hypothetical protein